MDVPIEELKDLKLKKYQTVLAKVITVDRSVDNRLILASTKISDCGGVDKNVSQYDNFQARAVKLVRFSLIH